MRSRVTALAGASALLLGLVAVTTTTIAAPASAAPITDLSLSFVSGVNGDIPKGAPLPADLKYQFLIQMETTGVWNDSTKNCLPPAPKSTGTDPNYPNDCQWPGTRTSNTGDPIVASGNQDDIAAGNIHLSVLQQACNDYAATAPRTANSPAQPCRFLISVKAEGYEIGGAHFSVPTSGTAELASAPVVSLLQYPIPLATIRARIFQDTVPADGVYEIDAEAPLRGFRAFLNDLLGDVSTDYYGNPLCTTYEHDNNGKMIFVDGAPVISSTSTGKCVSDSNGDIVIPNMAPGRYGIVIRPDAVHQNWLQTTTLEGAQDHDWWVMAGDTGYGTETTAGGELVPEVQFGFVPPEPTVAHPWVRATYDSSTHLTTDQFSTRTSPNGVTGSHSISGSVHEGCTYIASVGGAYVPNAVPGANGSSDCGPIKNPNVAISAIDAGDQVVWAGKGDANGNYTVNGLADGQYMVTVWDAPINHILETFNVNITGSDVNAGVTYVGGWFTHITGSVFIDTNGNGKRDPGEQGVARTTLTFRERDNTPMDQFTNLIDTDPTGHYDIIQAYPLSRFMILEHANPRFKPTGITVQACNEDKSTTYLGGAVDISVEPVIGLCGNIDWAVEPFKDGETGGIAGTISYGTTRNELTPADAATEDWQPGIQGVPVNLYAPVLCGSTLDPSLISDPKFDAAFNGCPNGPNGDPMVNADGSLVHGPQLAETYTSESYQRPQACVARDRTGAVLTGEQVLADPSKNTDCVEAPLAGWYAKPSDSTPGATAQTVNGNYGFGSSRLNLFDPATTPACTVAQMAEIRSTGTYPLPGCAPLNADDSAPLAWYADLSAAGLPDMGLKPDQYIVGVEIPKDSFGHDMYKITKEEDVNIFGGDQMLPQENFPASADAGSSSTCTPGDPNYNAAACSGPGGGEGLGVIPECAGPMHTVHVTNPDFIDGGGSPYEGQQTPLCTDKLVDVVSGTAQFTNFEMFTDVPLASHFWGLILNDLGVSSDPTKIQYGEVEGIPNAPTGIYDWAGNLVDTAIADPNGFYEAIEPSTVRINNPSPSGVSPGMYKFVGNDPGTPGHLNPTYDSRYRTIATNFQAWPGLWTVTDTAPTLTAAQTFDGQMTAVKCTVSDNEPQLFRVDDPVVQGARTLTITGRDFGSSGQVLLGGAGEKAADPLTATPLSVLSWSDTQITVAVPAPSSSFNGARQLMVRRADNGKVTTNGVTLQVLGGSYTFDRIYRVGPGLTGANEVNTDTGGTLQDALNQARAYERGPRNSIRTTLVVAYPQTPVTGSDTVVPNPTGAYQENLILDSGTKIQGVGPGGFQANGDYVQGSVIDGSFFDEGLPSGQNWLTLLGSLSYDNSSIAVPDSAAVTVLSPTYNGSPAPALDGFTITGGIQSTTPTNINILTGGSTTPYGGTGAVVTQGGGIYVHGGTNGLVISNNKIDGNSGSYAGGIRVGTPYANSPTLGLRTTSTGYRLSTSDSYSLRNQNLVVAHNSITNNGGANLAGGVGLFSGTTNYRVAYNDVCGNFSAEYGGGISHYGYSGSSTTNPNRIDHNRIWFNESYDEGGAVLVAGEIPPNPDALSGGSGTVLLDHNRIDQNLANDDGGGIRLLNAGARLVTIENNEIVNNVSAHEGGGISLNDASNVTIDANTIARNVTTATAVTSDGTPAAAGISTSGLSTLLKQLVGNEPTTPQVSFTDPTTYNNVIWDNRAGAFDGIAIHGISDGDANVWDIGSVDEPGSLVDVRTSVLSSTTGTTGDASNSAVDPKFASPYTLSVHADARRSFVAFRQTVINDMTQSPWNYADYAITTGSPAIDFGTTLPAVTTDVTGYDRIGIPDAGAFELRTGADALAAPGVPTIGDVTAGNGSLAVAWTAGAAGNPAATSFIARAWTAASGGDLAGVCTSTGTGCTITGLTNGTTYHVDVLAYNAVGQSAATDPRVEGTPTIPPPGTPTNLTVTPVTSGLVAGHALDIRFTPNAINGLSTGYLATAHTAADGSGSAGTCTAGPATSTSQQSCRISGLTTGTTYWVDVVATYAVAPGTSSAPTALVSGMPATTPGAPTGVTLVRGSTAGSLVANWTAPGNTGGVPLVSYTVQLQYRVGFNGWANTGPSHSVTAPTTTYTFTGLPNFRTYRVSVTATNAAGLTGNGGTSSSTGVTPAFRAGTVAALYAPGLRGGVRIAFTAPGRAAAPGTTWVVAAFTTSRGYRVAGVCTAKGGTAAVCTITHLVRGRTYFISIKKAGTSWPSPVKVVRTKVRAQ